MTTRTIALRTASRPHAALLAALHARAYAVPWSARDFAELLAAPGVAALLAVSEEPRDEAPVGFVLMRHAAGEAEILALCVIPEARGQGVGGRLIDGALEALRAMGARAVFLEVGADNIAAKRLYARAGFVAAGVRRGYYRHPAGDSEDAVILRRALT
jgi:ribosomal-protein-alanine N-acetyltransferase